MKTFEELKKIVEADPDKYDFNEYDVETVEDIFADNDLTEDDFVKENDKLFTSKELAEWIIDKFDIDLYDVGMYNDYIEHNHYTEYLYDMAMLDDVLADYSPTELINMATNGNFNLNDAYFYSDDYGYLMSCNDAADIIDHVIGMDQYTEDIINENYGDLMSDTSAQVLKALFD